MFQPKLPRAPWLAATALIALAAAGCTAIPQPDELPPVEWEGKEIVVTDSQQVPLAGEDYTVTSYENPAYECGRTGVFPFVVVEQSDLVDEERPLWVMLHGGGTGWYDESGHYQGVEAFTDQEPPPVLLVLLLGYLGADGTKDTFVGERVRAGDRVVLGSLCDHDLMMGIGQPYPNNPRGGTVDGLLANLAMVDAVVNGAAKVEKRPTSSTWILGQSAGSYGAWPLAHQLWLRGLPLGGMVLDSGLMSRRSFDLFDVGIGSLLEFDRAAMEEKHGPYFTEESLYLESAVSLGFDVPFFNTDTANDPWCGGRATVITAAIEDGLSSNCEWLNGSLADVIEEHGNPELQQVRIYDGKGHIITHHLNHRVQDDLRAWFAAATGRSSEPEGSAAPLGRAPGVVG